jgi:hypothetical protein
MTGVVDVWMDTMDALRRWRRNGSANGRFKGGREGNLKMDVQRQLRPYDGPVTDYQVYEMVHRQMANGNRLSATVC